MSEKLSEKDLEDLTDEEKFKAVKGQVMLVGHWVRSNSVHTKICHAPDKNSDEDDPEPYCNRRTKNNDYKTKTPSQLNDSFTRIHFCNTCAVKLLGKEKDSVSKNSSGGPVDVLEKFGFEDEAEELSL